MEPLSDDPPELVAAGVVTAGVVVAGVVAADVEEVASEPPVEDASTPELPPDAVEAAGDAVDDALVVVVDVAAVECAIPAASKGSRLWLVGVRGCRIRAEVCRA